MIQRRAAAATIKTRIGNHTSHATGITAYLKNNGTLEDVQYLANYKSPRTTRLYDRRNEEISLDEMEKISISVKSMTSACSNNPCDRTSISTRDSLRAAPGGGEHASFQ
jgi:hypothetical protein